MLSTNTVIMLLVTFTLEWLIGEPRTFHPLIGLGHTINKAESIFNHGTSRHKQIKGALCVLFITLIPTIFIYFIHKQLNSYFAAIFAGIILWLSLGVNSLINHSKAIYVPLKNGNIDEARTKLSHIVSRDTKHLQEGDIAKATCESTLENTCDAVIAPLFWGVFLGPTAVIVHRILNTFDAMWGYKNARFIDFGRFAAKSDDIANYIPARLTAFSFLLVGQNKINILNSWRYQSKEWDSPNAGLVMATGAAALNIILGGHAIYGGTDKFRAKIGYGALPDADSIVVCDRLIVKATMACTTTLLCIEFLYLR